MPGKENPSDSATRSELDDKYDIPEEWTKGPWFLKRTEEEWPEDIPWAVVKEDIRTKKLAVLNARKSEDETDWEQESNRISWEEAKNPKEKTKDLIRRCQEEEFLKEVRPIKGGKNIDASSNLTPVLDQDGILRVGGRIGKVDLPYKSRHPVILPAKHEITRKIVRQFHEGQPHGGTNFVLVHIRQYFWPIHGREATKRATNACPSCIKERLARAATLGGLTPTKVRHADPTLQ